MKTLISLLIISTLSFPLVSLAANENTDLLSTEPTITAPSFSYHTFASCGELEDTMQAILPKQDRYFGYRVPMMLADSSAESVTAPAPTLAKTSGALAVQPHSETNIQVVGIDEADTVKTDGIYIYSYQAGENGIIVLDAKNLNKIKTIKIPANYSNPTFYIQKGKLILTATRYSQSSQFWRGWYDNSQKSILAIYDITDISDTKLIRLTQVDGTLVDTRLEDNGLFTAVVSTSYWTPPYYRTFSESEDMPSSAYRSRQLIPRISDVRYHGNRRIATNRTVANCTGMASILPDTTTLSQYSFSPTLTSIVRFDTSVAAGDITSQVVLSDAPQIHVTRDSVYLTSNMWTPVQTTSVGKCTPDTPCATASSMIWNPGTNGTLVHRFSLDQTRTQYVYSRLLSGSPLSQYSMDEDALGNFRIVTSLSDWTRGSSAQSTSVSVLDKKGTLVGSLRDIAPGENFQSSRFIGDRLYLVTFEQIDPLFVISLSDVKNPTILGELKIPGYSTYLHPYDANRLIGIGYDTFINKHGGTQNDGIKVDLYNVADVKNPKQEATLTLGDAGSTSDVLSNPRAFVYYKEKNLLLMPATLMTSAGDTENSYLSKSAFQGLLGLSILPSGITEKFRITHISKSDTMMEDWKVACKNNSYDSWSPEYCKIGSTLDMYLANNIWNYSSDFIRRVLYVGESLYTIGESKIQMQNFANPIIPTAEQKFKVQNQNIGYPMPIDIMPVVR